MNRDCVFARLRLAETCKPFANYIRITPAIQDRPYSNRVALLIVIDGVGEPLGQQPMIPKLFWMNSRVKPERFDVGKQRFQKIVSHACFLPFIKLETVGKIIPRRRQNGDPHFVLARSCSFAVSQSMKDSLPCFTRAALSERTSPCHAGDSNCASSRVKSLQRVSITRSFSATVIFSNGNVTSICLSIRLTGDRRNAKVHLPDLSAFRHAASSPPRPKPGKMPQPGPRNRRPSNHQTWGRVRRLLVEALAVPDPKAAQPHQEFGRLLASCREHTRAKGIEQAPGHEDRTGLTGK
jgi:hypothetical protein